MKDKYTPGQDCNCHAYSESECGCGADWTPSEVYELREQLAAEHCRQLFSLAEQLAAERALADRLAEVLDYYYSEDSRHHIASNRAYARAAWNALAAWKEARSEI